MWWFFNKKDCLKQVKYELFKLSNDRSIISTIVIAIIQNVIDTNREDILKNIPNMSFNPINDAPLILYILEHYELLKPYPIHRYHIKKVLKSSVY